MEHQKAGRERVELDHHRCRRPRATRMWQRKNLRVFWSLPLAFGRTARLDFKLLVPGCKRRNLCYLKLPVLICDSDSGNQKRHGTKNFGEPPLHL